MVWTLLARMVVVSETPMALPILRIRLVRPAPSVRNCGRQGGEGHQIHRHKHQAHAQALDEGDDGNGADADVRASSPSSPTSTRPAARRPRSSDRRGSIFMVSRPANIMANMVPKPARHHQKAGLGDAAARQILQIGRDQRRGLASSTSPITNISTSPPTKLRSLKIASGMKGFFAVNICTRKR